MACSWRLTSAASTALCVLETAADLVEDLVKLYPNELNSCDDHHCNERGDQTVLDGCHTVFFPSELPNELNQFHGSLLCLMTCRCRLSKSARHAALKPGCLRRLATESPFALHR